jgi:hypothetical protein
LESVSPGWSLLLEAIAALIIIVVVLRIVEVAGSIVAVPLGVLELVGVRIFVVVVLSHHHFDLLAPARPDLLLVDGHPHP